jgi:DDE family transposase
MSTKIHMVVADARTAITFALSPGEAHDAPQGRKLLRELGEAKWPIHLLMDRAYEGDETGQLAKNANRAYAMLALINVSKWGRALTGEVSTA